MARYVRLSRYREPTEHYISYVNSLHIPYSKYFVISSKTGLTNFKKKKLFRIKGNIIIIVNNLTVHDMKELEDYVVSMPNVFVASHNEWFKREDGRLD